MTKLCKVSYSPLLYWKAAFSQAVKKAERSSRRYAKKKLFSSYSTLFLLYIYIRM